MSRLPITKTPKVYVGGAFIRSESARTYPLKDAAGNYFANIPQCTRKDLRNAVEAAAKAGPGWAKRTAYNRGQIIYRLGEMIEARKGDMADALMLGGASKAVAAKEIAATIDRLIYYAGWTDKYEQVLGNVNPVASPHFNFTTPEPTGVVVVLAPDLPVLLPMVSLLLPVILSGNTAIVIPSERAPLPALSFAEILATSDLLGGVVNILAGKRAELAPHIASHMDVNAIVDGAGVPEISAQLRAGVATNLKRYFNHALPEADWFTEKGEDPYWILDTVEMKTAWLPIGL